MPKKKIESKKIEERILEILDYHLIGYLSIRNIKIKLEEEYGIKVSPQIVKRYLLKLEKEGKIQREKWR